MRILYNLIAFLLLLSISLLIVTCKKDTGPVESVQNDLNIITSELVIGTSGGKVEDSFGASITIPAGAVSSDITVSVRTLSADSIPSVMQSGLVENMIECLPKGATFLIPVTIVIPIISGVTHQPGDTADLYIFNSDSSAWEMTSIPAIVTADSLHLQASVSHFTSYGTDATGSSNAGKQSFGGIDDYTDLSSKCSRWADDFVYKLGGIGAKKWVGDCCMNLANVVFNFQYYNYSLGYSGTYSTTRGDQANCDKTEHLQFSEGTQATGYSMLIDVNCCWTACNPDISIKASSSYFLLPNEEGKTSDITVRVKCGDMPPGNRNLPVQFFINSGPGRVDPPIAKTDAGGTAKATYTVESEGDANVTARIQTCASTDPQSGTADVNIKVEELKPDNITAIVAIQHEGEDMPWKFYSTVTMILDISLNEDVITVTGGEGSQDPDCESTDPDCSVIGLSAPDFTPTGTVTKIGDSLKIEFNPNLASVNFTYYCDYGEGNQHSEPVPAYSFLVSSIIAQYIKGTIKMEDGSYIEGDGSDSFGEDVPLNYQFQIVYACSVGKK